MANVVDLICKGKGPSTLKAGVLDLTPLKYVSFLPQELECHTLIWKDSPLVKLPEGFVVKHKLDLSGSKYLRTLPVGLKLGVLTLRDCPSLEALPEGLQVDFLDISDCRALSLWPESAQVSIGSVRARNCVALKKLPERMGRLTFLDLAGCASMESLSPGIQVGSWVDLGGTQIDSLPEPLSKIGLRWRGVNISARIAFFPETLTSTEVLAEPNAEVRRVMIERMGFERFLKEANAIVLDRDRDAGGPRQLLRVELAGDEPLVCVSVLCPSTGRHYLIRVPPTMVTCHQAVAWTAGFDNAADYRPEAET